MIRRYTLPEMGAVWSEMARFEAMLRVELAVARAQAARGQIPAEALGALETRSSVDVERIAEIEKTTDHDVIAFVSQVAESVGPEGRYLHLGLTSSDVVDTGLALQLRAAGERLLADCDRLTSAIIGRARAEAETVMMGRTHSVHAEPTTLGLKLAGWAFEVERGRTRLAAAVDEIGTGKISGPVGTYSHLGPDVEAEVLAALGLHVDPVSTQIVQRDRHAALLGAIAVLGGSLERFATEVRNLQHTEIGELQEPFTAGQKGSSAMPHKRNPILSERIAGLAGSAALARARYQPLQRRTGHPARLDDHPRLHARADDRAGRGTGRPLRADAREHRPWPRSPRLVAGARRARGERRALEGGCVRDRPAGLASGGRRTSAAARPVGRGPGRRPEALADAARCVLR